MRGMGELTLLAYACLLIALTFVEATDLNASSYQSYGSDYWVGNLRVLVSDEMDHSWFEAQPIETQVSGSR